MYASQVVCGRCVNGHCSCSLSLTHPDYLNQNADMFQRTATRLKRKLWWQNIKLWIILIVIILVIVIVIISECTTSFTQD